MKRLPKGFRETVSQRLDEILGGDSPLLHKSSNPTGQLTVTMGDHSDGGRLTRAYREAFHSQPIDEKYTDVEPLKGAGLVGTTANLYTAKNPNGETVVLKISKTEGEIPLAVRETSAFSTIQADGRHPNIVLMEEANTEAGYFVLEYVTESIAGKYVEDVLEKRKEAAERELKAKKRRKEYLVGREAEAKESGNRFDYKERRELAGIDEKIKYEEDILAGRIIPSDASGVGDTRVLRMYVGILRALKHCHELGIVHRDIKPDNIRYASEGLGLEPRLFDFGGAIDLNDIGSAENPFDPLIKWSGSPLYVTRDIVKAVFDFNVTVLDAEQEQLEVDFAERDRILKRQDLVELALTTYHMATGIPPYHYSVGEKGWENRFLTNDEDQLLLDILDYDQPAIDMDVLKNSEKMDKKVAKALADSLERCLRGVEPRLILPILHQNLSRFLSEGAVNNIYGNRRISGRTRRIVRPSSYDLNNGGQS